MALAFHQEGPLHWEGWQASQGRSLHRVDTGSVGVADIHRLLRVDHVAGMAQAPWG